MQDKPRVEFRMSSLFRRGLPNIVAYQGRGKRWRFRLETKDGQVVALSTGSSSTLEEIVERIDGEFGQLPMTIYDDE